MKVVFVSLVLILLTGCYPFLEVNQDTWKVGVAGNNSEVTALFSGGK